MVIHLDDETAATASQLRQRRSSERIVDTLFVECSSVAVTMRDDGINHDVWISVEDGVSRMV